MTTKPVAAVYDRRRKNEPTLTERRYRAVYDRRAPTRLPVAAVYDRRAVRRFANIICLLLFFPVLSLSAAPQKQTAPPVDPTIVLAPSVPVKVGRGGACEVTVRAISSHGYDVEFLIDSGPSEGSLSRPRSDPRRKPSDPVSYLYTHNGKKGIFKDSFRVKAKAGPHKAWGYANVTIRIEEPPARFAANVSSLDFSSVFLGESRSLPVRITNAGGGKLQGNLKVGAPWRLADPSDLALALAEGETKEIFITFEPLSADIQRGSLTLDSKTKSSRKIPLQGSGKMSFEAPENAAFEQHIGAKELRIPVKNLTAAPLTISVDCPLPLESPASLDLAPESTGELILTLPQRPFAEQNTVITLSDGTAARDIRIQLPPPPSRLEWEILGKRQFDEASPGRLEQLTAKLHNTGSGTANVVLRPEGDGLALAPDQPANLIMAAGESVTVNATWKFPETPGAARASLIAEAAGLPPVQDAWEADVQHPLAETAASPYPTPGPSPSPTPPNVLTKEEQEALRKRLPSDLSYRLEPEFHPLAFFSSQRTAVALVSWSYGGAEPVEFIVERELLRRKGFFDKNPFERTLPTTDELPPQSLEAIWTAVEPAVARIQKLPDGRWQARIPALSTGYHKIRIIAKQPDSSRMDGLELRLSVGDIPLPQLPPWAFPSLIALCATYLLRNKIRSLFQ